MVAAYSDYVLSFAAAADESTLDEALARLFRLDRDPALELPRRRFAQKLASEVLLLPHLEVAFIEVGCRSQKDKIAHWLADWNIRGSFCIQKPYVAASLLMNVLYSETSLDLYGSDRAYKTTERNSYLQECIRVSFMG